MRKTGRKIGCVLAAAVLLCCLLMPAGLSVWAVDGYENHRFSLVSEPDTMLPEVAYYKDGAAAGQDQMTWVEGVHGGKALSLGNGSDYLEYVGADRLRLESLSFSAWVKWRGAININDPQTAFFQRLFSLYYDENKYMTFTPYAQDYSVTNLDGGVLDGMCLEYKHSEPDQDALGVSYEIRKFDSAVQGFTNYALPVSEWHHIAMVADGKTLKLYVDGTLHFEETLMITMMQLSPNVFSIGHGIWNNPTLNAAVDEAALYDMALTPDQVRYVMDGGDPAGLTTASFTSVTSYVPTKPIITEPSVAAPGDTTTTVFQLPVWGLWVLLGVIAVIAGLTLVYNIYTVKKHPATPPESSADDDTKGDDAT